MKSLRSLISIAAVLVGAAAATAQNATLKADNTALVAAGGTVQITAAVAFDGQPGAIGWSIEVPKGWTLVAVSGPDIPAVAPTPGTASPLEFAYTSVPAGRSEFSITVKYPTSPTAGTVTATALVRTDGKLSTVKAAPLSFAP